MSSEVEIDKSGLAVYNDILPSRGKQGALGEIAAKQISLMPFCIPYSTSAHVVAMVRSPRRGQALGLPGGWLGVVVYRLNLVRRNRKDPAVIGGDGPLGRLAPALLR
jgi:hypothetical protein